MIFFVVKKSESDYKSKMVINPQPPKVGDDPQWLPMQDLCKGTLSLSYFGPWKQARLGQGRLPLQTVPQPDGMCGFYEQHGERSPQDILQRLRDNQLTVKNCGMVTLDGLSLVHACLADATYEYEYWFDPARGYLPYQCELRLITPGRAIDIMKTRLIEAKEFPGGKWFPMHVVKRANPVDIHRVTELKLETEESDFNITLPPGCNMVRGDTKEDFSSFKLKEAATVSPDQLVWIHKMLDQSFQHDQLVTALLPPPAGFRWYWLAIVTFLAMAVGFIVFYKRRMSFRAAGY